MKSTGSVNKSVANVPNNIVEAPTSAVKAKGTWRALKRIKNNAAVMVAVRHGKNLVA